VALTIGGKDGLDMYGLRRLQIEAAMNRSRLSFRWLLLVALTMHSAGSADQQ